MSNLFQICVLALTLLVFSPANSQDMFNSTTDDPLLGLAIHEFENICVQFVIHERQVSYKEDLRVYRKHIESFGYTERDLTETEKANQQMVNPAPRQIFKKTNPDNRLTLFWEHFWDRRLWAAPSRSPGQSCTLSAKLGSHLDENDIQTHIFDQDPAWQSNEVYTRSIVHATAKSAGQCTEFEGETYFIGVSFRTPAILSGFSYYDEVPMNQNAREDWVPRDDPSLDGGLLTLTISRNIRKCTG